MATERALKSRGLQQQSAPQGQLAPHARWRPDSLSEGRIVCPICSDRETSEFFRIEGTPIQEGYLWPGRKQAVSCDTGRIALRHCKSCRHVWNALFDPTALRFDSEYDINMFHSSSYRDYVEGAMERLLNRYGLKDRTGLEIACGKGDFLRIMIGAGMGKAIGFDPTFQAENLSEEERKQITAHSTYFGPEHADIEADLIACRSALQYFTDPMPFLKMLRQSLGNRHETVVYFEVPNGEETFDQLMIWNVVYEHGCFFNRHSLKVAFEDAGFEVLDILSSLGGSQLEVEARPARLVNDFSGSLANHQREASDWTESFASMFETKSAQWRSSLQRWATEEKRVVLWGAGARAIGFLTALQPHELITQVVDINPQRQGRYLPGGGQLVIAPEQLKFEQPDVVIVSNPNFAREIEQQVRGMGLKSEIAVLT